MIKATQKHPFSRFYAVDEPSLWLVRLEKLYPREMQLVRYCVEFKYLLVHDRLDGINAPLLG